MTITELTNKIGVEYNKSTTEMGEYAIPNGRIDRLFSHNDIYVIVETKNNINHALINDKPQLDKYCDYIIEHENVKHIIGILCRLDTNEVITFVDGELRDDINSIKTMAQYEEFFVNAIDKDAIYKITMRINNNLHSNFGMTKLSDRMIFTACALVAKSRFNCDIESRRSKGFEKLREEIRCDLAHGLAEDCNHNDKLILLLDQFSQIVISGVRSVKYVDEFINDICELSTYINNKDWRGEDVMAIFFNEFNRYRAKSDLGQVFTPEHIAEFMCRILDIKYGDRVLDAACGSGTFLTKAMSIMLKEAGDDEEKRQHVFSEGVYGVEYDPNVYTLAVANMLIHKDGKTNLIQGDTRSEEVGAWIKKNNITKVLMNPPYEDCYGCMTIVKNVLDNVPTHSKCAFILPNNKLTVSKNWKKLANHRLTTIIKIPTETFDAGTDTSIFIFETGVKQDNYKVCAYRIIDDGLVRVKNRGRHDVLHRWEAIMTEMLDAIKYGEHETKQIFNLADQQGYALPIVEEPINIEDFVKNLCALKMFDEDIDPEEYKTNIIENTMYEVV